LGFDMGHRFAEQDSTVRAVLRAAQRKDFDRLGTRSGYGRTGRPGMPETAAPGLPATASAIVSFAVLGMARSLQIASLERKLGAKPTSREVAGIET